MTLQNAYSYLVNMLIKAARCTNKGAIGDNTDYLLDFPSDSCICMVNSSVLKV